MRTYAEPTILWQGQPSHDRLEAIAWGKRIKTLVDSHFYPDPIKQKSAGFSPFPASLVAAGGPPWPMVLHS